MMTCLLFIDSLLKILKLRSSKTLKRILNDLCQQSFHLIKNLQCEWFHCLFQFKLSNTQPDIIALQTKSGIIIGQVMLIIVSILLVCIESNVIESSSSLENAEKSK